MLNAMLRSLHSYIDPELLSREIEAGHIGQIHCKESGCRILDYTRDCMFDRVWNPATMRCRGLVVAPDDTIVALPFTKFHNINEPGGLSLEDVVRRSERDRPVFTDKVDGSMVLFWRDPLTQKIRSSTRGSFTSDQAVAALEWMGSRLNSMDPDWTLICEWVGPENRIVLRYDEPECIVLGVRHIVTKADYPMLGSGLTVERIADQFGLRTAAVVDDHLNNLMASRSHVRGVEGWVGRFSDGTRFKIKTDEYMALHRVLTDFRPERVHEAMVDGTYDALIRTLPEEFRPEAETWKSKIDAVVDHKVSSATSAFAQIRHHLDSSRKDFAMAAQLDSFSEYRTLLFRLADGASTQDIRSIILSKLDDIRQIVGFIS